MCWFQRDLYWCCRCCPWSGCCPENGGPICSSGWDGGPGSRNGPDPESRSGSMLFPWGRLHPRYRWFWRSTGNFLKPPLCSQRPPGPDMTRPIPCFSGPILLWCLKLPISRLISRGPWTGFGGGSIRHGYVWWKPIYGPDSFMPCNGKYSGDTGECPDVP